MDACLSSEDWDEVDRYASALEDYTRQEPLPWTEFFIARGRALAKIGRGQRDEVTIDELKRVSSEAKSMGKTNALGALKEALAAVS